MITTLSELVAATESNGDINAVRFEPNYVPSQANVKNCVASHRFMSLSTARNLCASSWGLYQIMGDNVYSLGYRGTMLDFWKDAITQNKYFALYCAYRQINYPLSDILASKPKRENFAKKYNGSILYADRLMNIYDAQKGK